MSNDLSERLKAKSVDNAIVTEIAKNFHLSPFFAEVYYHHIKDYILEHLDLHPSSGKIHYMAIDDKEPAGKPVALCKKTSVLLTLHNPEEDLDVYKESGLRGLRQHRLLRITKEAIEQGALLSYEDIAFLLTTSIVTIKRDVAQIRRKGLVIPSRGWRHQMGRGQTHKTQILELYLSGHQFSDIEKRTHHSQKAVQRYIQDFTKIVLLHQKDFSVDQIRIATNFSSRLIGEYLKLHDKYSKEQNPRLKAMFKVFKKNKTIRNKNS
jgi:hypothetical protein